MRKFEHRLALPEVLDQVHRKTVRAALGGLGIKTASDNWTDLERGVAANPSKVNQHIREGYDFSGVEYISSNPKFYYNGTIPVGRLFGEPHTLLMSSRTPYMDSLSDNQRLSDDTLKRRITLLGSSLDAWPDMTTVYLLPDIPPIALSTTAIMNTIGDRWRSEDVSTIPDTEIIEKAQKRHAQDGVEYISEEIAQGIATALKKESSRLLNSSFFES